MKSKKQRATIQCKGDKENDEVRQRKYKCSENKKIKKKVNDYARKQVIEQTSSDESDAHTSSKMDEIKNDKPQRDSSYDLETDSMQEYGEEYDEDKIVHIKVESRQKQSLQIKLKEIEKILRDIDLKEQTIGSTKKQCDEKYDRINETKTIKSNI